MTAGVKKFIEQKIGFIEAGAYEELFEEAYNWLTNSMIKELMDSLTIALKVDMSPYAEASILKQFDAELKNFVNDEIPRLSLVSLAALYMSSTGGFKTNEFLVIASNHLKEHPNKHIRLEQDADGDWMLIRKK